MKKYLLVGAYGLLAHMASAQRSLAVPTAVRLAFQKAQPQAAHVFWHQCPVGYEVAFEQYSADQLPGERKLRGLMSITPTGELVESRLDVTYRGFPPLGHTAISQQYPHRQLDRIVKVINAQGEITYETKICKGKDKNGKDADCQTSHFDKDGRPLSI